MASPWPLLLKNLFLPVFCRECGRRLLTEENGHFCPTCWELCPRIVRPFCSVCGRPHQERAGFGETRNFPCEKCRSLPAPPYRRIYAAAHFGGAIAEAIKLVKFHDKHRLATSLAVEMAEFAQREIDCAAYHALVPVPLHKVRLRERGFNQARLLAEALLPVFSNARLDESLQRIRPTRVQSRLKDAKERASNVAGAFAVNRDVAYDGQTLLLIDDVVTTGGTVAECAIALRRAGAIHVDVLAVAIPVETDPLA